MNILGLDTTGPWCSALIRTPDAAHGGSERLGRGHSERLAPMVAEAFAAATLNPSDIDRVAVCTGPGSFTGLRVALAFARGFALPHAVPVVGVDALSVWAAQMDRHAVAVADIRRGQIVWAAWRDGERTHDLRTQDVEAARPLIEDLGLPVIGTGAPLFGRALTERLDPDMLCRLAEGLHPATHPPRPVYGRGPDAKLPGGVDPSP